MTEPIIYSEPSPTILLADADNRSAIPTTIDLHRCLRRVIGYYPVIQTLGGGTALRILAEEPVPLLVIGLSLFDMTCVQLALKAREAQPDLHVVIVAWTHVDELLQLAPRHQIPYLIRPYLLADLARIVADALRPPSGRPPAGHSCGGR